MDSIIQCKKVSKIYKTQEIEQVVLRDIDITINRGELVAIVGKSGSGKSTLLNILGCLSQLDDGQYYFQGRDVSNLDSQERAKLRCHNFGFIFQSYQLLSDANVINNVELPSIYAEVNSSSRKDKALGLLKRLGLEEHIYHKPSQLSGGQQQRVSIARALQNNPSVILADEPTGALDDKTGDEVLSILKELHSLGNTIILVTHDLNIAAHATRIIELRDGVIIKDESKDASLFSHCSKTFNLSDDTKPTNFSRHCYIWWESLISAIRSIYTHKSRTFLTILGIIIGIGAVVSVVALGQGARTKVLSEINSLGTNTITILSGKGFGDKEANLITSLNRDDLIALSNLPYLSGVSPELSSTGSLQWRNKMVNTSMVGISPDFFGVKGIKLKLGRMLTHFDSYSNATVAVINENLAESLFGFESPLGKVVLAGNLPLTIVGVVKRSKETGNQNLAMWLPYETFSIRYLVQEHFNQVIVRIKDGIEPSLAEQGVKALLIKRHGEKDFFLYSNTYILKVAENATLALSLLITGVAMISLVVGGVGVMNVMLVSVVERTREIGIRMAIGATQRNILRQFLIEAVLVTQLGGLLGTGISLIIGAILVRVVKDIPLEFSFLSLLIAVLCSSLIGIIFGYLPALKASKLHPVEALSKD